MSTDNTVSRSDDQHEGLAADLPKLLQRRRALGIFGGVGLSAVLAACGSDSSSTSASSTTSRATPSGRGGPPPGAPPAGGPGQGSAAVGPGEIPEETNGPFPADGTNGQNILTESGVVREDLRASFGGADGVAEGIELTVELTVVDVSSATDPGSAVVGAAVYAWQCDREGNYSMYSEAVVNENYLRGVQATDKSGKLTFTTIFPGCYPGRWPHIHFEVYPTLADATKAQNRLRTSQLAFPAAVCEQVYQEPGYEASLSNLAQLSLDTDGVFSDGYSLQLAKVTGTPSRSLRATLRVPI